MFCYFWESLSPEIQMWSSLIFSQTFGSWYVGGRGRLVKVSAARGQSEGGADSPAWGRPQTVKTPGQPPMPASSQLDFPGHLIQSEAVSFSSILQPINHAGNQPPDSVPSSWLLKSLWPQKSAIWNFLYERRHHQPSINKASPFLHLLGGHLNLVRPHWRKNHYHFNIKKPPFHSACARHSHLQESVQWILTTSPLVRS